MQQPAPPSGNFDCAIALFSAGRFPEAESLCRDLLAAKPDPHVMHMLALIRADAGAVDEALGLLEQALATGVQHPAIHFARGRVLLHLGRATEALAPLRDSLRLDAHQPRVVAFLGKTLVNLGQIAEARDLLDASSAVFPGDADLREASGAAYMAAGRYEEASRELERAIAGDPMLNEAYGNLAVVYEQLNRLDDTRRIIDAGLARRPDHPALRFVQARLQRRDGDAAGARSALEALRRTPGLAAHLDRDIEFELGWCADALDETASAMAHFQSAKDKAITLAAPALGLDEIFPRQMASLTRVYGSGAFPLLGAPQKPMPAFLLGFPRSGTTLLDTMLGAHPELWVMEEQPTVQAMLDSYLASGLSYADDLIRLTPPQLAAIRAAHQRASRSAGWDGARGLIDKSPFATVHLGLIQQAYPAAPVIFMARHPCDVVLSCFMNNFEINSGSVHFAKLGSAVTLYCGVMELWQLYLRRLALRHIVLRYEDLIVEPERELRRLLSFLDLPWSPKVLENSREALKRGRITTPSYHQVSRPLYQDARNRWRRYAKYLEPHLQRLRPHIEAFGYDA